MKNQTLGKDKVVFRRIKGRVVPIRKKHGKLTSEEQREKRGLTELKRYHSKQAETHKGRAQTAKAASFATGILSAGAFLGGAPRAGGIGLGAALVLGLSHKYHRGAAKDRRASARAIRKRIRARYGHSSVSR